MENRALILKLLVISMFYLNLSNCQDLSMSMNYIENSKGIKEMHQESNPLLEKVFCHPDYEPCNTLRIYDDGSLYFYSEGSETQEASWAFVTDVKLEGILQLKEIFKYYCSNLNVPGSKSANSQGVSIYRFKDDDCLREVIIQGVAFDNFEKLESIDTIINSNLNPFSN